MVNVVVWLPLFWAAKIRHGFELYFFCPFLGQDSVAWTNVPHRRFDRKHRREGYLVPEVVVRYSPEEGRFFLSLFERCSL